MRQKNFRRKIPLSLFWQLQLVGWTGYAIDRYIQAPDVFFPVPFTYLLVAFALSMALRWIYRRLWSTSPPIWKLALVIVACSFTAAYLWLLLSSITFWLRGIWSYPQDESLSFILLSTLEYSLTHHKPFLFLSWSVLYFGIKYWQRQREEELRALRADAMAREAELEMLRYQLNPHFLFNSLNSASALIREDPTKAEQMIGELSDFLRYSLAQPHDGPVALREELETARKYLAIEKVRFEDKLDVKIEIDPAAESFRVPSMLLQPLIENAVKFGMQTSPMPLRLSISARLQARALRLEVRNTGSWVGKTNGHRSAGVGLANVRRRLEHAFPNRHRFDVRNSNDEVVATLELDASSL